MAIYQLPTGTYETWAAFAMRGGSLRDKRHSAATAILVTHPQGDLLIDAGFGSDIAAHVATLPPIARAPPRGDPGRQRAARRQRLRPQPPARVLVTHSQWDHVSGRRPPSTDLDQRG